MVHQTDTSYTESFPQKTAKFKEQEQFLHSYVPLVGRIPMSRLQPAARSVASPSESAANIASTSNSAATAMVSQNTHNQAYIEMSTGVVCPPLSKNTVAQRAQRERERQSAFTSKFSSNNFKLLSRKTLAQRARREREKQQRQMLSGLPPARISSVRQISSQRARREQERDLPSSNSMQCILRDDLLINTTNATSSSQPTSPLVPSLNNVNRVIEAIILTGDKAGETVFIPRITLTPTAAELPIPMSRRQFPIRLAFAMTINKSQGQSIKYVGIDLQTPVFSHGQLYVALSRCTSANNISVLLPSNVLNSTANIVYPEALL